MENLRRIDKRHYRRSFTIKRKLSIVEIIKNNSNSKSIVAKKFSIHRNVLNRWIKIETQMKELSKKLTRRTMPYNNSYKNNQQKPLIDHIKIIRNKGEPLRRNDILKLLDKFIPSRQYKTLSSNISYVSNLCRKYRIVKRKFTSYNDCGEENQTEEAKNFLADVNNIIRDKKIGPRGILNADETSLKFLLGYDYSLDFKGVKKVRNKKDKFTKSSVSIMIAANAFGESLTPFVMIKGKILLKKVKKTNELRKN